MECASRFVSRRPLQIVLMKTRLWRFVRSWPYSRQPCLRSSHGASLYFALDRSAPGSVSSIICSTDLLRHASSIEKTRKAFEQSGYREVLFDPPIGLTTKPSP
jgi:hypothetical protein